jgi:hypothetical protein
MAQDTQHGKPIALTETGHIPDLQDGQRWLWFMVWNDGAGEAGVTSPDNFWTGEHHNSNAHKRKIYGDPTSSRWIACRSFKAFSAAAAAALASSPAVTTDILAGSMCLRKAAFTCASVAAFSLASYSLLQA